VKKAFAIFVLALSLLAALWWFQDNGGPPVATDPPAESATSPPGETPTSVPGNQPSKAIVFPEAAREEMRRCLHESAADMEGFEALLQNHAGEPSTERIAWRVLEFVDREGRTLRLRLSRERGQSGGERLFAQLYSVDAEGLPDPLPLPPALTRFPDEARLQEFLSGVRMEKEVVTTELAFKNGSRLERETEDGKVVRSEFIHPEFMVACSTLQNHPTCHCRLPR
jgi:hypothetical protein